MPSLLWVTALLPKRLGSNMHAAVAVKNVCYNVRLPMLLSYVQIQMSVSHTVQAGLSPNARPQQLEEEYRRQEEYHRHW